MIETCKSMNASSNVHLVCYSLSSLESYITARLLLLFCGAGGGMFSLFSSSDSGNSFLTIRRFGFFWLAGSLLGSMFSIHFPVNFLCDCVPLVSGAKPTNPSLYARVKAEAKRKYKVWPSAYASGWLTKTYKARGGGYR